MIRKFMKRVGFSIWAVFVIPIAVEIWVGVFAPSFLLESAVPAMEPIS